jgi:hypothetical protein
LLAIQISKLVKYKVRDTPEITLKLKHELAVNQYPELPLTPVPPPDQTNNTNNKNQTDMICKETVAPRTSNRRKRLSTTRKDFFMETVTIYTHNLPIPLITKESGPNLTKNSWAQGHKIPKYRPAKR